MKKGNQFYLEVQLFDENNTLLDIASVSKVQFNIGTLTKTFDYTNEEVIYDEENQAFKIWISEQESFDFESKTKIDARILFKNDTIAGSVIDQLYVYDSLKKELLDDKVEDTQ